MSWSVIAPTPDKFQLFTPNVDLEASLQHPEDSLAIPAEANRRLRRGRDPLRLHTARHRPSGRQRAR